LAGRGGRFQGGFGRAVGGGSGVARRMGQRVRVQNAKMHRGQEHLELHLQVVFDAVEQVEDDAERQGEDLEVR
jgi:hypothetical protein